MKKYLKSILIVGIFAISFLNASPIIILENKNIISGHNYYCDVYDEIYEYYEKESSSPIAEKITYASSSADIFNISTYALNCDIGHSHDVISSAAYASSLVYFTVNFSGNYQFDFYGEMEASTAWSGKTNQYISYILQDIYTSTILIEQKNELIEEVISEDIKISIDNSLPVTLQDGHIYLLKLEGSVSRAPGALGYISQKNFLLANINNVPEPAIFRFIFLSFLYLILLIVFEKKRVSE